VRVGGRWADWAGRMASFIHKMLVNSAGSCNCLHFENDRMTPFCNFILSNHCIPSSLVEMSPVQQTWIHAKSAPDCECRQCQQQQLSAVYWYWCQLVVLWCLVVIQVCHWQFIINTHLQLWTAWVCQRQGSPSYLLHWFNTLAMGFLLKSWPLCFCHCSYCCLWWCEDWLRGNTSRSMWVVSYDEDIISRVERHCTSLHSFCTLVVTLLMTLGSWHLTFGSWRWNLKFGNCYYVMTVTV